MPRSPSQRPRRSLSSQRSGGRIDSGGEPHLARALAESLRAANRDEVVGDSLTHPLHSYPARMHPATARQLIELVMDVESANPAMLVDPFCGSGTTLVEARAAGVAAAGVDLSPLAVLLSSVKTWKAPRRRRQELLAAGRDLTTATIAEGKAARRADYEPRPLRAPRGVDRKARDRMLHEWFPRHVRRELEFLGGGIEEIAARDPEIGDALRVCLSAILIKASRRASDTDPRRVDKRIARSAPARWFRERVELLVAGLDDLEAASEGPPSRALLGDARDLAGAGIERASAGAVVTSPPYVGTYDYTTHHDLRLAFLGIDAPRLERGEIASRRNFARGAARAAGARTRRDLVAVFESMAWSLAPGGLAAVVIGDSIAGGDAVWADELIAEVCSRRFDVAAWAWQERPVLGGTERRLFGERPKREHAILLRRHRAE